MEKRKTQSKQNLSARKSADISGQLEQAFLAGLGALSNAQEMGAKTFDSLVEQGEAFRKEASDKTETLLGEVQHAIRGMAGDAQSKATGLLDQMRDASQLDRLSGVFDSRVAGAMDRLGVPSKNDISVLNAKLDNILSAVKKQGGAPSKKASPATTRRAGKKAAKKTSKKVAKKKR